MAKSNPTASATGKDPSPNSREAFVRLAEPYRRQLKVHCYRMTGSLHDAEDLVQETLLRGWRAFGDFEGRGSLRGWLYQIATRACLDSIARGKRARRLLPEDNFPPATAVPTGQPPDDIPWLEPFPDSELETVADENEAEARYEQREAVRLAFVAAIQHLPPRQRAVLMLVDVLGWSSAECASLIGGSTASVNSALQRARATLERQNRLADKPRPRLSAASQQALLDRYVRAWEEKDVDAFVNLLREDATYSMPPWSHWYSGRESIGRFFGEVWKLYGRFKLLPTRANDQPAFILYTRTDAEPSWRAHSVQVLSLDDECVSGLTLFMTPLSQRLVPAFGFPLAMEC